MKKNLSKTWSTRWRLTMVILMLLYTSVSSAQKVSNESGKDYKNVVRFNLSNFLLFGPGNIIIGYERTVSPSQSFSVNLGRASLPSLLSVDLDSLNISKQASKTGFNISADYRFYLQKENKHRAPRGVYIGPYVMFNKTRKDAAWEFVHKNGSDRISTKTDFLVFGAGVELGYQFVFFKRMTLDLVLIGPGLARYDYNVKIDGTLDEKDREQLFDVMKQAIEDRYPGTHIAFGDKEFNSSGRLGVTSVGFRYLIQVGFRF